MKKILLGYCILALAACDSSEEEPQIDYSSYDDKAIDELIAAAETDKAIEIIQGQIELGIADANDYLKQAEIYNSRLDGVATEVAVEKAREHGVDVSQTALMYARALVAQEKYEEALVALEDVSDERGEAYSVVLLKADIAKGQEKLEEAESYFQEAISLKPDDSAGYLGLAISRLEQADFEGASGYVEQAASISENDALVNYVRGSVARYQERYEAAINYLQSAIAVNQGHVPALLELAGAYIETGELELARQQLDAAYATEPRNPMIMYYGGLASAIEGKAEEAEELLLQSGDLIRSYPPATRTYAYVAYTLNKCDHAQQYFERFLRTQPDDKRSVLALADCMTRMQKPEKALELLNRILVANPNDLDAIVQAAGAAAFLENSEQAREIVRKAYNSAMNSDEFNREMLHILGRRLAHLEFATGNSASALSLVDDLQQSGSVDPATYILAANIHMEMDDLDKAADAGKQLIELNTVSAEGYNVLGAINYRKRNLDEAISHYSAALDLNPDYQSARKNRALALIGLNQYEQAESDLLALVEQVPDDPQLLGLLGRVYIELDKGEAALPVLKRAERALPRSAIITIDHAVAMAQVGYVTTAIAKAHDAKELAGNDGPLSKYIDGLIATWEQRDADRLAEKAKIEAEELEAFKKKQEELRKTKEAAKQAKEEDDSDDEHRS